jgi:hypothetical protein
VVDAGNQDGVNEPKPKQELVDAGNQGEVVVELTPKQDVVDAGK